MLGKLLRILRELKQKPFFKDKKKLIENCIIAVIVGIIIIIAGGALFGKKDTDTKNEGSVKGVSTGMESEKYTDAGNDEQADTTERELETILSRIKGAGKVMVMITYSTGKEVEAAFDTRKTLSDTQETDNNGGTRTIIQNQSENTIVYEDMQEGKKALITREILPVVKGALIVAEGASDAYVKQEICSAVMVLLDLPMHRVQVLEMRK